ncbi:hypothetical protein [Variovorax sp. KK3]|uniref:hypothetical protein n=1 Tax=Variovorax sp. KK3 TaxID=1855728 RepID=UPI0021173361|nr:hypothetical protein [Variovorax sp. KK3]
MRPAFSVTTKRPPGRKATPQGFSNPEATTSGVGAAIAEPTAAAARDAMIAVRQRFVCRAEIEVEMVFMVLLESAIHKKFATAHRFVSKLLVYSDASAYGP